MASFSSRGLLTTPPLVPVPAILSRPLEAGEMAIISSFKTSFPIPVAG